MANEIDRFRARKKWGAPAHQQSARQLIGLWRELASKDTTLPLIVGVWILVAVPPALFHGYHYVEGLTVTIAQSALDDGDWLTPHVYNLRWIERPTLLSFVIAAISLPTGHVIPFVARLPVILSLLAGAFLVWRALCRVASDGAAAFGALAFLASPIVIRYYVTAVADLPLAVLLFGAFLVWWQSYADGRLSLSRWICIGGILATAALLKGPQPVAYFMLGISAFVALTSTWRQLPGLVLAGVLAAVPTALWYGYVYIPGDETEWLRYTRLASSSLGKPHPLANAIDFFFESFPAALPAIALLLTGANSARKTVPQHFILALSCYAFACTFAILFWPAEVNPRYVLPMVPALSVLAGIAFDALSEQRPVLIAGSALVVLGLLVYAVTHSLSDVLLTPAYNHSKVDGLEIAELVRRDPAPLYRTSWKTGLNELAYVPERVMTILPAAVPIIAKPAWILVPAADSAALIARGNGRIKPVLTMAHAILLRSE